MTFSNRNLSTQLADEKLAQAFYTNGRYNALFLGVTGIGFLVIYLLTRFNIFGETTPQLLYISGDIFFLAIAQLPLMYLARRKRGIVTNFFATIFVTIFAILLVAFWQGIVLVCIIVICITPLLAIYNGMPRQYHMPLYLIIIAGIIGILSVNATPPIDERLQTSTSAAIASLAFLGTTGLLLITVTTIARSKNYRSLRTQLLVSFLIIVTIPTLLATILSAVGAYVNNEAQAFDILETVLNLKENQINAVIENFKSDVGRINQDTVFVRSAHNILEPSENDPETLTLYKASARNKLVEYKNSQEQIYAEIMVLDIQGQVMVSTDINREGKSFQSELFYRNGVNGDFTGFSKNPTFGNANLVFSTPLYGADGTTPRGVLVLRSNSSLIKDVVENTPGFAEMETYLLDKDFFPLTETRAITETVNTVASENILTNNIENGKGTYESYTGDIVLGYYQRLDALDAAFIAEVPRASILQNSINSLFGSATLVIFAIFIAIAAVAISASSIAEPISALAKTAENFAEGKLTARVSIDRRDEIGALGKAYDQMAEQLQDIIGKLEQRVTDRTKELQDQSLRLRTSAEIARDAASSHNLNELLDKAASLIQERFEIYHTGIFLLDNNGEYAVLTASPTPAGKQMIANNHKLRVGEVGIVGRVAATGEPRITLDTGSDAVHFNNPLLPETHSEMALPLKVENRMIGVLDVQSDQQQAFDENDVAIMQILADQLATAIERTRLLQQVEQNLSDLEQAYGQFTREGWKTLGEAGLLTKAGYRFDNVRIQPIVEIPTLGDEALKSGNVITANNTASTKNQVAIPIKLRGQTIGVVTADLKDGYTQNTISTLELAVERLALSLESTRLYEEARLRADREQMIAQVTSSISSATEFDTILRTTVEELGKTLGNSEVSIQIISDTEPASK